MERIIESVFHPTDFSEGSRVAFYHALKASLLANSKLTLMNVSPDATASWDDFPGVRETLEDWNLLPRGSSKAAVGALGIDVRKVLTQNSDPVHAVVDHLSKHPAELIVLATHHRTGAMRWLSSSVAEPIARHAKEMTLFIAGETKGFVSPADGSVSMNNVLIPVALSPGAQPALDAAARLVKGLDCDQGTFTLLHVGTADSMPAVRHPNVPGWEWKNDIRTGDVIQSIVDASNETNTDLIVMTTDGRHGFLDGLRGSHSERVIRLSEMPVLTVPVGSSAYEAGR
jgi:nucleotide-binding universal stress UspA family protein